MAGTWVVPRKISSLVHICTRVFLCAEPHRCNMPLMRRAARAASRGSDLPYSIRKDSFRSRLIELKRKEKSDERKTGTD